jgi:acyl-coenzyme A thioesterase PaaI-like protein
MRQDNPSQKQSFATEQRLTKLWKHLGQYAVGRWIFNSLLRHAVPYSGSIRPQVKTLSLGFAEVSMQDRRKLRNHLDCIHAIALANLGELASGLAMISALPVSTRAIVSHLEIEYIKKARGRLTAIGRAKPPKIITKPLLVLVHAEIKNQQNEMVAIAHVMWHLSPKVV